MNIQTNSFPTDFYQHLDNHTLTGIKAGKDRTTFLNIWMVNVDGRIFARSWGKSNRSWFTTLLDEKTGQIKYGDKVLNIRAKPCKDALMNTKIDHAYRTRYTTPENLSYAIGITQPEYADYTMEFQLDQL
ncbi:DUF2255 family protein [Pontibacter sp. BT310]|uniref:DUF2255 family protein n=1 Tax=Pontibacter populi TaxID=890055 RepID=A0ABS6XCL5_9BACT|nr:MULTISPECIES: DUF2255 family protein [Pontibacter]MBJ6118072.1 DUF2255 family protein [Pontibacter sp. BT310]MBR0570499.1 DUF2255 family protein [Microvirga sp. STS03]MBW3364925.1 DUF2255 family protein [Pontibacter populi]